MEKICWSNTDSFDDAKFIVVGIPDESKSHALRKGTEDAPNRIRQVSWERDSYHRKGQNSLGRPLGGMAEKTYDIGNISRDQISEIYSKIAASSKIPISLGGDHSITAQIVKTLSTKLGEISLVYFDAHPDFVSSVSDYYGSVIHDISSIINFNSSIQIGIRTPEDEELDNISTRSLSVISPFDIQEQGIKKISEYVLSKLGKNVYVSFDMDCIDPAFAPGVSVPVPMGLNSIDAVYLLKKITRKGIIGIDIMEVCPQFDIKDRTSHLASRMISEVIYSGGSS